MSKLGNIDSIYGKKFNVAIANTHANVVLSSGNLPSNTLIITAPYDELSGEDLGVFCLIMTDAYGTPIRISHSIKEGNGLYVENGLLKVKIDGSTIIEDNGILKINLSNIIDDTLNYENNKLQPNISNFTIASQENFGVFKIDNDNIKINGNVLYIDTSTLLKSGIDNFGIATGDNKTILTSNGVLSVDTTNLNHATKKEYGIVKPDGSTIVATNNKLNVVTNKLDKANSTLPGIVKGNNKDIFCKNGILSLNEQHMTRCSHDKFGVASINKDSLTVNKNGIITVNNTNLFDINKYEKFINELNIIEETIKTESNNTTSIAICSLSFNQTSVADLRKPTVNERIIDMRAQNIIITMNVVTTTDFELSVNFLNNVAPNVTIKQVTYDKSIIYTGEDCLKHTFTSTNGLVKTIELSVECFNFNSNALGYNETTTAKIIVSKSGDTDQYKSIFFSIIRYNADFDKSVLFNSDSILAQDNNYEEDLYNSVWYRKNNNIIISLINNIKYALNKN